MARSSPYPGMIQEDSLEVLSCTCTFYPLTWLIDHFSQLVKLASVFRGSLAIDDDDDA